MTGYLFVCSMPYGFSLGPLCLWCAQHGLGLVRREITVNYMQRAHFRKSKARKTLEVFIEKMLF